MSSGRSPAGGLGFSSRFLIHTSLYDVPGPTAFMPCLAFIELLRLSGVLPVIFDVSILAQFNFLERFDCVNHAPVERTTHLSAEILLKSST